MLTDDDVRTFEPTIARIAHTVYKTLPSDAIITSDDLIQAGQYGLFRASLNFCSSHNTSFTTYASWRIRGAMLDDIRTNRRHETSPVYGEEDVYQQHVRLDEPFNDAYGDSSETYDRVSDVSSLNLALPPSLQEVRDGYTQQDLRHAMMYLPPDEWRLAWKYYFSDGLTLRQLGEQAARSEGRMSQRLGHMHRKLAQVLTRFDDTSSPVWLPDTHAIISPLRRSLGMSQARFAREIGLSQSTISRSVEGGLWTPHPHTQRAIQHWLRRASSTPERQVLACDFSGEMLRSCRLAHDLTQTALAQQLHVDVSTIIHIEQGQAMNLRTRRVVHQWMAGQEPTSLPTISPSLGTRVKAARKRLRLSQSAASQAIGVSARTLKYLETQPTFASRCRDLTVIRFVRWLDTAEAAVPTETPLGDRVRMARKKRGVSARAFSIVVRINVRTLRRLERDPAYVPPIDIEARLVTWLDTCETDVSTPVVSQQAAD